MQNGNISFIKIFLIGQKLALKIPFDSANIENLYLKYLPNLEANKININMSKFTSFMSPFDYSHQYYVKRSTEHLIRLREAILNAIEESSFILYPRNDEYESMVKEEYKRVY